MTWYLLEANDLQPTYVQASSELGAMRVFAEYYGDDHTVEVTAYIEDDKFDHTEELDTPNPPFRSLEEDGDAIILTEKRVNQAGSKGLYQFAKSRR